MRNGVYGWLCALLPLVLVNALGYLGLLSTVEAALAGAAAIAGGPLLGGGVVGLLAGRRDRRGPGGATGAFAASLVAGGLYLASLLALVVAAAELDAEPELLAAHPVRVALAAVCLACVLAALGLGVAALVGRRDRNAPGRRRPGGGRHGGGASSASGRTRAVPTASRTRAPIGASAPLPMAQPAATGRRPSLDRGTRR